MGRSLCGGTPATTHPHTTTDSLRTGEVADIAGML
jgi:hypothetical protein